MFEHVRYTNCDNVCSELKKDAFLAPSMNNLKTQNDSLTWTEQDNNDNDNDNGGIISRQQRL